MITPLLVVTIDLAFGELMRRSLDETGKYRVLIAHNKNEALSFVKYEKTPLAFLDSAYKANEILELGRALRQAAENIQFIVISDNGWHSALEELTPYGYLPKPFHLPDLLELLDRFFAINKPRNLPKTKPIEPPDEPVSDGIDLQRLEDVNRAAQHLTRLTLESSAQAALITRDDTLWSYAGQLPQAAARELVDTLSRYWDKQGDSDLLRFVRLNTTEAEHMLYATQLASGMVLALVFDAETSFTTIRSQASNLVRSLSVLPSVESKETEPDLEGDEIDVTSLLDILGNVPPPTPQQDIQIDRTELSDEINSSIPLPTLQSDSLNYETSPAVQPISIDTDQVQEDFAQEQEPESEAQPDLQTDTRESPAQKRKTDDLADTRPRPVFDTARRIVLEPVSPSVYNLTYACLLIPRFTHHLLRGDLRDRLSRWIPQISVAYGWRLEHISIRPDHIQWMVNVPPAAAPGYLMRIFRQQTSEKIFTDFPQYKKENPSGDFWAPGYLIMGGSQLPPERLIKEYIEQTRHRQGLSGPYRPE